MLKLELELSDLDYDAILNTAFPQLSDYLRASGHPIGKLLPRDMNSPMARRVLASLPQAQKDKLLAELINLNHKKVAEMLLSSAASRGVHFHIHMLKASAERDD